MYTHSTAAEAECQGNKSGGGQEGVYRGSSVTASFSSALRGSGGGQEGVYRGSRVTASFSSARSSDAPRW
eukprot:181790-Pyramimonas_sp.AAC.1